MADTNTFQWKWNAANGSSAERLKQIKTANEARIAQLERELEGLRHTERMTDQDMLDLELASNRARAYDLPNSVTALSRIEERRAERNRDARETFRANQTKQMENDLKISELQKQYQQELNELANSSNAHSDATHKTNLKYLGERIQQLGGEIPGGPVAEYRTRNDIMTDYWDNTVNTKTGRKFGDDVDDAKRSQLVEDLRSIGEFEKADALQATKTPAEIDADKKKESTRRAAVRAKANKVNRSMVEAQKRYRDATSPEDKAAARKDFDDAVEMADSLARNYPDLVKKDGQSVKYTAKD